MTKKVQIHLEELEAHKEFRNKVNAPSIEDIEWLMNGEPVTVEPEFLEFFRFVGLCNMDFWRLYPEWKNSSWFLPLKKED